MALIGPNGAGKTTLMSCLLGDRKATKGQVLLDGLAPQARSNKETVAVLPQENAIPTDLKVKELLRFSSYLQGQSDRCGNRQPAPLFPRAKNQLAGKLSGGQKRLWLRHLPDWQAQVALFGRANGGHGYVDPSAFLGDCT